jgi:hypothetical protein
MAVEQTQKESKDMTNRLTWHGALNSENVPVAREQITNYLVYLSIQ